VGSARTKEPAPRKSFSPLLEGDTSVGYRANPASNDAPIRFSPLLEGDTSVGGGRWSTAWPTSSCFSPLLEGDTSVGILPNPP